MALRVAAEAVSVEGPARLRVRVEEEAHLDRVLDCLREGGARLRELRPLLGLEELFLELIGDAQEDDSGEKTP